ncbi:pyridoxamine 5'-phosphate oxidase [Anseongella ginsenosidimutans]|uniref:Pyridoxine/pyridoxamine 5'-phosphate oxidase n=1 Tax=Anseongella ginsenosidimutans TaxID=496056 RepID=A0A4R3KP11_9SPHI|nr:pyridoxamine 5'-phosphate oxidase [Anseongella ginsenosidimutans]TCS86114.1 pyridoxamine 5'-phosphate oxidase [Anseongella ginsenosidimutans]
MSTKKDILRQLRKEYTLQGLSRREVAPTPFQQFDNWFLEAWDAEVPEPNAMTLCTVGKAGKPSARIVLLKDFDEGGFVFYTNYNSLKGQQIAENPFVSLSFFWQPLERQVRIEGIAEKIGANESDQYFQSRPRGSRLAAIASPQSQVIESRDWLEKIWREQENIFTEKERIPRPENWGGFSVKPERVEFWQGRDNRLHDRIVYETGEIYKADADKTTGQWRIHRLAP